MVILFKKESEFFLKLFAYYLFLEPPTQHVLLLYNSHVVVIFTEDFANYIIG